MSSPDSPTDIRPDPDLEAQVRAMLVRRADDIGPTDIDPDLPDGVRIALVDERRPRRGAAAWYAAAAVLVVLALVAGAVLRQDDERGTEVATATSTTAPDATSESTSPPSVPAPEEVVIVPGLPAGLGLHHLATLWDASDPDVVAPEAVALAYLVDRLGDAGDVEVDEPSVSGELSQVAWRRPSDPASGGIVHLAERDGRWVVVAATAPQTFDVSGASLADGNLEGSVVNLGARPWAIEVSAADLDATVGDLAAMTLGTASICPSPCDPRPVVYIADPTSAATGRSSLPLLVSGPDEALPAEPHRLQAVTVHRDARVTGGEQPTVEGPAVAAFSEIAFDPTLPAVGPPAEDVAGDAVATLLASLPAGVDPTVGPVAGTGAEGPSATAAAEAYLEAAYGSFDAVTRTGVVTVDRDGLWLARYEVPPADLEPEVWGPAAAEPLEGTLVLRRGDDGIWAVVAATSSAIDITGVRYDRVDGGLRGEVRATVAAPLEVTVSTLAGDLLAEADLTTHPESGTAPSTLGLDDLLEVTDGQPVVLRVAVGDGAGQVGLDGVEAATVATVVLPGWA